jgi:hypothetical protein
MSTILAAPSHRSLVVFFLSLLLLLGCGPVRLVSSYDEVIDQRTSDLHTKIGAFVGRMETLAGKPEGTYLANQEPYVEINAEIATLRLHAAAVPKNEITVKLIDELSQNVDSLRKLHEIGGDRGLRKVLAGPALSAIDVNCGSIIKFEIAKKRGESPKE